MVNKKENTTMVIPKTLRAQLTIIKQKYDMTHLHQVVQLLYNIRDKTLIKEVILPKTNKEAIGNQSDALDNHDANYNGDEVNK